MKQLFPNLSEDTKLRVWCIEKAFTSGSQANEETLVIANKIYRFITEEKKVIHTRTNQHPQFAQFYILRDFDLRPEKLEDYPTFMNLALASELTEAGLLFETKDEALKARELMLKAISNQ